ncbi:MAG: hypothetical protein A3C85_02930 [Candidatus Doudnabacteria bacterium RIFCSPHIGHO2_02_FULL_48_21]|nr:MAG: hypothetical protein A3K05_00190 [Candidatus Doudnabacteria bacterium RIFCSPHIGHO2_01_48_18]OGE79464.1 MAG: hypothetical protein A2668_02115 [Candidatus Doudnabacteria bacterium RIFCSPHIGHO2_01_FULL_48_180]OGE93218.1 MAG: hypothetical protein A3C85_02930 [Candidatus Doudnabacteria bacterium RIFCSPHIGHO2_02_FULL_48_21]OGE97907.1 MAG: hypothetical protein A3A83_03080 [Candidatus Doudnabacteria bacterium RIFCSPLOWO2_01_FULL_48_57]OGF01934.1 MAG: hypothetical protein A3G07_02675 [Candidatus
MFNVLFAFVLLFQVADPFAALEKSLAKNAPVLTARDAAFKQFQTAVNGVNAVDVTQAWTRYITAWDEGVKVWLPMRTELDRASKAVISKQPVDAKTKDRLAKLTAQVELFMKHPAGYDDLMKKYRERIGDPDTGPQVPVIRKPKQP